MKYNVTFYFHTNCTVAVEADNEDEALEIAMANIDDEKYTEQILTRLQEDASPDIVEA